MEALTVEDVEAIRDAAVEAGARIREYAPRGDSHIGIVGDSFEFQEALEGLRECWPETFAKLGPWRCDGVALTEVWFWSNRLEGEAVEALRDLED